MTDTATLAESLQIVHYPHPTLRHKSKPLRRVDEELVRVVERMFELMYAAKGIGLAANQVDLPVRLFVVNLAGEPGKGEELVFLNPVVGRPKGTIEMEEGCLSLPGVYGPVVRPKQVALHAYDLQGKEIDTTLDGMMARVVQHELDHLDGVLFIDRLTETGKLEVREALEEFEVDFDSKRGTGQIPHDDDIRARLQGLQSRYCE